MIDTHTHLYLPEFSDEGMDTAVDRALAAGVDMLIFPNVDTDTVSSVVSLYKRYPESTRYAMGLHPTEVKEDWRDAVVSMQELMSKEGCVAVGEVGVDLYWDKSNREYQLEAFRAQLRLAQDMRLPVIIHCREALSEVLLCIAEEKARGLGMVFHSFTGGTEDVRAIRKIVPGAKFGINGVVTFKNAAPLREALPEIGIENILLETDSPYLAPVPYRGRRNESANLGKIRDKIGEVLQLSIEEVEQITDRTARLLFHL